MFSGWLTVANDVKSYSIAIDLTVGEEGASGNITKIV